MSSYLLMKKILCLHVRVASSRNCSPLCQLNHLNSSTLSTVIIFYSTHHLAFTFTPLLICSSIHIASSLTHHPNICRWSQAIKLSLSLSNHWQMRPKPMGDPCFFLTNSFITWGGVQTYVICIYWFLALYPLSPNGKSACWVRLNKSMQNI